MYKVKIWIFSEIDRPPDFNENLSTNIVLNVVSYNDVRFLRKLLFKKLYSFKVIYFICNTEETQTPIFPIYCMLSGPYTCKQFAQTECLRKLLDSVGAA